LGMFFSRLSLPRIPDGMKDRAKKGEALGC
jgi:hypothetical protein